MDLLKTPPRKLFFHYLLPSISATLVTSIYILADSIIIGKGVGPDGIAALNLILPLFSLFFGLGTLLGVGGGVLFSVSHGNGDKKSANGYFTAALLLLGITIVVATILGLLLFRPLLFALGATEDSYAMVADYGKYIVAFCGVFMLSNFLQTMVRNDKAPHLSMVAVISGGVTNVVLDLVFIYPLQMGMAGGAIATVIGSAVTVVILLFHFLSPKNTLALSWNVKGVQVPAQILRCGAASFFMDIASGVVIFVFNHQILRYIGGDGVVVYSIISNCTLIAMSLFNGVAQAAQPTMATNYGAGQGERVLALLRIGLLTTGCIGAALFLVGLLFPAATIAVFVETTAEITALGVEAIPITFTAFLFMGFNVLLGTFFQSILRPNQALLISLSRGMVLSIILVLVLPFVFGTAGIWWAVPAAEALTLAMGGALAARYKR